MATACKRPDVQAVPIKPAAERLVCEAAGARPAVPAEYVVDWSMVEVAGDSRATLDRARAEATKLVASVRTREGVVAGYILRIEGQLFACSSNAEWLRNFYGKLPDVPAAP